MVSDADGSMVVGSLPFRQVHNLVDVEGVGGAATHSIIVLPCAIQHTLLCL